MRRWRFATLIVVAVAAVISVSAPLRAQSADSVAVLAVIEHLFTAMAQRDTGAAHALFAPRSQIVAVRSDTAAAPRVQSDTAFVRALGAGDGQIHERIWSPTVQIRGPLAMVWAPYD